MPPSKPVALTRRALLGTTAAAALCGTARAVDVPGGDGMPWAPDQARPPVPFRPGPWLFFTHDEGRTVEAIVERLIPADALSPSGKDAGCAVFIDRQLAGPYGEGARLYMKGPFAKGAKTQGQQSPLRPAARFRAGLAALDAHCRTNHAAGFADLDAERQVAALQGLEAGTVAFDGPISAKAFFELVLARTMEGFFADPIYGGNRDMVGWRMIGFPGTRYDWTDWVERHDEAFTDPPISIAGAPSWTQRD
ncbi:MAG: gluconate 2-dehydrogenase subunit 3 family protein [Parafilimonas terrae]|nr:gluconate 2-dehydrogenase subunit 3 family protein [Parafilimonas terrae]